MIVKKVTAEQLDAGVILCVAVPEQAQSERQSLMLNFDFPEAVTHCIDRFFKRNRCL
jgi:hypothetical protein